MSTTCALLPESIRFVLAVVLSATVAFASASYQQDPGPDGLVLIDTTDFSEGTSPEWTVDSGLGQMRTSEPGPTLHYRIIFVKSGTHHVWVRGRGLRGTATLDAGLEEIGEAPVKISLEPGEWRWVRTSEAFRIPAPGEYTLRLRLHDAGAEIGQVVVTTNDSFDATTLDEPSAPRLDGAYYLRLQSGEPWEEFARVGPDADVLVRWGDGNELVFWRGASYLPYWQTKRGRWFVDELIPRRGDGEGRMHDRINRHSSVKVIENTAARVVVHWRYVPDLANPGMDGWAEEYFTAYPDGLLVRAAKRGTKTLADWQDPANVTTEYLALTPAGITPLPNAPATLTLADSSKGAYADPVYDKTRRAHVLRCRENGRPPVLDITLAPARNPAIVVKDWGDAGVQLRVNGQPFDNFRAGTVSHMNGADLVVWLALESEIPARITLTPAGGSPPVNRAPVPDPYSYKVPVFPEGSADPGPFGAYYTHLKYFPEWDEPWRVGNHADVVVQFDDEPYRLIFWRGADFVPHWANDRNFWYENEFCERRAEDAGGEGCCGEPMQDHEARYGHARIIHSNDARVIVHWRYSPADRNYKLLYVGEQGWGDWVDEYYTVYPDGISVRNATLYTSALYKFNEWHEAIPLVNPGMIPEDILEMEAVALSDLAGDKRVYSWENGFPTELADGKNILLIALKGRTRPFAITESSGVWVDEMGGMPDHHRFNHYDDWPGWPASQRRRDWERNAETGYREFWRTLPSHSSLLHLMWDDYENQLTGPVTWRRKIMLNGMTADRDVNALVPLARSWERPPALAIEAPGFEGGAYNKAERAYQLRRTARSPKALTVSLAASAESPVFNPCLVIDNWPETARVRLSVNGRSVAEGPDFRQGIEETAAGGSALVIWLRSSAQSPLTLEFTP